MYLTVWLLEFMPKTAEVRLPFFKKRNKFIPSDKFEKYNFFANLREEPP